MIQSEYNRKEHILYIDRKDEIEIQDLFALVQDTVSGYKELKCLLILDDARGSAPKFSSRDYPELIRRVSEGLAHFREVRQAILVDSPMNTALASLFREMTEQVPGYSFRTFFYEEEAKEWLTEGIRCFE